MTENLPNVKTPVWSGEQQITGLWFSTKLFSHEDSTARMLASWIPGSNAFRFEQGDLLRFPGTARLKCETQSGLPLCAVSNIALVSAPLTIEEISGFRAFDVLVIQGAQVDGMSLVDAESLDLSQTIDTSEYALHETFDCSQSVRPLNVKRMEGKDIRTLLGDAIPPPKRRAWKFSRKTGIGRHQDKRTGWWFFGQQAQIGCYRFSGTFCHHDAVGFFRRECKRRQYRFKFIVRQRPIIAANAAEVARCAGQTRHRISRIAFNWMETRRLSAKNAEDVR